MQLAKGKNGKIGRQIVGQGEQAKIVQPTKAGFHRNLYLSEGQIKADHDYFTSLENQKKIREVMQRQAQAQAAEKARAIFAKENQRVLDFQNKAPSDPMLAKLRAHYAKQVNMPQHEKTARGLGAGASNERLRRLDRDQGSLLEGATSGAVPRPWAPADFSNSGANMHLVPSGQPKEQTVWRADFRSNMIKGNPLTRDGKFGPNVTDYDRFVQGTDVNDGRIGSLPIVGNTMLGRYEGPGKKTVAMGFDPFSLSSYTGAFNTLIDKTSDNLVNALPDQLAKEIQDAIMGGGTSTTNPATGQVTIVRPAPVANSSAFSAIPKWAIYTGVGMLGLGVLFAGVSMVSKVRRR